MNPTLVTTTEAVDKAFYIVLGICGLMLVGVTVAMLWFLWRYNRKRQPIPLSQKDQNLWLEVTWTIIPTVLVMLMFWYGWEGYLSLRRVPDGAMHIKATARMWSWSFAYDNGKIADKLYVPVGQPVKVELIAEDVLHSFYVPAFRVKRDTVPGMPTYAWFVAEKPGSYDLFCAEYCGVGHSSMITTVEALPVADFSDWLQQIAAVSGEGLLQQHGCLGCHSLDGSRLVGPTLKGLAGQTVEVVTAGQTRTLTRDRAYLERSLLDPAADLVDDYPPAMPSYAGRLSDADLTGMVDFLLQSTPESSTKAPSGDDDHKNDRADDDDHGHDQANASQRGAALAAELGCLGCHSLDGSRQVGPSFKGIFGRPVSVEQGGGQVEMTADAAYLERAIRTPSSEIVVGYPPAMPPYPQLSDEDLAALLAWLQSVQ